jgi:hypothetical protein
MRYDFECSVCKVAREMDVRLEVAPKVGETYLAGIDESPCSCGSRAFVRVMERRTGGFVLNFRRTSL